MIKVFFPKRGTPCYSLNEFDNVILNALAFSSTETECR